MLVQGVEGVDDFYEDDEPVVKIAAAFERGPHGKTAPPDPGSPVSTWVSRTVTNGWATKVRVTRQPHNFSAQAHERVNSPR